MTLTTPTNAGKRQHKVGRQRELADAPATRCDRGSCVNAEYIARYKEAPEGYGSK